MKRNFAFNLNAGCLSLHASIDREHRELQESERAAKALVEEMQIEVGAVEVQSCS